MCNVEKWKQNHYVFIKINPTSYINIYDYEYNEKIILYIPIHESDLVHNTKGEVFDRNVDGDYKVTSPERIANIYARKQKVNTEDELFPYAKMSDLRPDLIKRARQMAINNSQKTHIMICFILRVAKE